jgi:hypothetical protein
VTDDKSLKELRAHFLASSTRSLPLAGLIAWSVLGILALKVSPAVTGKAALYIMVAILPLAFLLDRLRGRNLFAGGSDNPVTKLFNLSVIGIGLSIPLGLAGADLGNSPTLVVLTMAVLAGIIWIPYGWAAGDPVGIRHAVGRSLGCYGAYALAPSDMKASAICLVVVAAYTYSLFAMRRPLAVHNLRVTTATLSREGGD